MRKGNQAVSVTLVIMGGISVIAFFALIAVHPSSNAPFVQDITLFAGLGVSTYATLRALRIQTKNIDTIKDNVDGSLSKLIDHARATGYDPDELEQIDLTRDRLHKQKHPDQ